MHDVGVVGLGYVGLTLATTLADIGLNVLGIEKRNHIVDLTNRGIPHFQEVGLTEALERVTSNGSLKVESDFLENVSCNTYIITVGTPLDDKGIARLDMIENATYQVARSMRDGALVILRSTVKVGTSRNTVLPILEASGKRFKLAMCPERTLEGRALRELRTLPQIVGAMDEQSSKKAAELFSCITPTIVKVTSLEAAEVIKLVDNTYRDVQFGFANEVARVCDAYGVNAYDVITSGKLGYERTNVPLPGLVGGPCLEKDPHILAEGASEKGISLEITKSSRQVNERQPIETVKFIHREIERRGLNKSLDIVIMGIAFKGIPETDDLRGSMSIKVYHALKQEMPNANISIFDPIIPFKSLKSELPNAEVHTDLETAVKDKSVVIIANNHPMFQGHTPRKYRELLRENGFIYDYWNHFSSLNENELSDFYFAVGNNKEISN